jgi:hypothetical protein
MQFLIAGPVARNAVSIGAALAAGGHSIQLVDRIRSAVDAEAVRLLKAWHHATRIENITDIPGARELRDLVSRAHAVVICDDDGDAFYTDLALALADAAATCTHVPPIIKQVALSHRAGAEPSRICHRSEGSQFRDFPAGIPEVRTLAALEGCDSALRVLGALREQPVILLRFGEWLAPGRFQLSECDWAGRMVLAAAECGETGLDSQYPAPSTSVDLFDSQALAAAIERIVQKSPALASGVYHLSGGAAARVTLATVRELIQIVHKQLFQCDPPLPFDLPSSRPEARHFDAAASRAALGVFSVSPRAAIERFYHFARRHRAAFRNGAPVSPI